VVSRGAGEPQTLSHGQSQKGPGYQNIHQSLTGRAGTKDRRRIPYNSISSAKERKKLPGFQSQRLSLTEGDSHEQENPPEKGAKKERSWPTGVEENKMCQGKSIRKKKVK